MIIIMNYIIIIYLLLQIIKICYNYVFGILFRRHIKLYQDQSVQDKCQGTLHPRTLKKNTTLSKKVAKRALYAGLAYLQRSWSGELQFIMSNKQRMKWKKVWPMN